MAEPNVDYKPHPEAGSPQSQPVGYGAQAPIQGVPGAGAKAGTVGMPTGTGVGSGRPGCTPGEAG